ncbi:MAG TPA: quinone-dependent dihydroorotate dehydrogenase [Patescibacteria group bacterium]|nr:quinone-dependent dihydroorotate dehydrogenase [Patescibacteria group bacterium]
MSLYAVARPLLMRMDPENAHRFTIRLLRAGFGPHQTVDNPALFVNLWGREFRNPLGMAAGFDKDAEVIAPLFNMGFGFVETGTVTPVAQEGNPRPRIFRDAASKSVINRMGFPGRGLAHFWENIGVYRAKYRGIQGILGVNIGINKEAASPYSDYRHCIEQLAEFADYITINVSSPNTAGLRNLQGASELDKLLGGLVAVRDSGARRPPLLLKVAPDLDAGQRADIAELLQKHYIDGLIVGNTTVSRPDKLDKKLVDEKGGLSGQLLRDLATERVADFYRLTGGRLPIIGAGGVASAADAYAKIRAGATLVQVYTGMIYEGPQLVPDILNGLVALLQKDGFSNISQAVGLDAGKPAQTQAA